MSTPYVSSMPRMYVYYVIESANNFVNVGTFFRWGASMYIGRMETKMIDYKRLAELNEGIDASKRISSYLDMCTCEEVYDSLAWSNYQKAERIVYNLRMRLYNERAKLLR